MLTAWSVRHSTTVYVFLIVLVLFGVRSYFALPREAAPDITIPLVLVTTPYVGVSPADMESLVTDPLEEELEQLRDVREIRSTSAEGASIVSIEFEPSVDIDDALQKIRERIDAAEPELPPDAEDPIITEISFSEFPVIVVNVSGDVGLLALKHVAEQVQDDIERIPGILDVTLTGGVEREIAIEADPHLLDFYRVTLLELVGVVQAANLNMPGGSIDVGEQKFLVRVPGEFETIAEIEDIVVRMEEGQPIYLRDVARVIDGYEDETTFSRLGSVPSVSISVSRRAGENILRITDEVKRIIERNEQLYGDTVQFATLGDVSRDIRRQLNELENNILTGLVLVVGVLLFFMGGLRNALFVGLAIPFSMLISFAVLRAMGVTLNIVVLFSLVLALGMLVDNAIVIDEIDYRHVQRGKAPREATLDAVAEVQWPIISSTMTTVGAFLPLMFWPGIMGEFMWYMPLTVCVVLLSSLFVALVINPVFCATLMRRPRGELNDGDELASLPSNALYSAYRWTLERAVSNRIVVLTLAAGAFVGTFMYYGANNFGTEFFPETTPERAYINITLPDGSNVEASDRVVRQVEAALVGEENIRTWVADVGAGNGDQMSFGSDGTAPHRSRITLEFLPFAEQVESSWDTIERLRARVEGIVGADIEIKTESGGPPTAPPINIEIVGAEYAELGRIAERVGAIIDDVDGPVNIQSDYESGRPEVRVDVDRVEAARVQVSVQDVANTVRAAISGFEASSFRDADDEYDILVRLDEASRDAIEDIEDLTVSNVDGDLIPITEIASLSVAPGLGSIRHLDGDRVVTISADVADGYNGIAALAEVQERVRAELGEIPGYSIRYTGENEDQAEAAAFLSEALLGGMFLIALILITQFNSIAQVFIILASVTLSLLGVLWGLLIREMPFNIIMTGVGIISLAGVVVNNSIVLIDYINQLRERGLAAREAVVLAGLVRLRPVLLTATTTALSLMPTVLGYNLDMKTLSVATGGTSVDMWGPMATAVLFGLIVATVLTLVIVPVLYSTFDSMAGGLRSLGRVFQRRPRRARAVEEDRDAPVGVAAPAE